MARTSVVIDVFLSSPGDLGPERDFVVTAAQEWNLLRSRNTGCHINIIRWEDIIAPAVTERPQALINEEVGDEYDVYLGLMWSRLGSPTGAADSGTVEEFDLALDRYRSGNKIRVAMFFKTAPVPMTLLDGEQFAHLQSFKRRYVAEGGIYREFVDEADLRPLLARLFEQIADAKDAISEEADRSRASFPARSTGTIESGAMHELDSEMGLIELNEEFTAVTGEQVNFFDDWTAEMQRNGADVEEVTEEMASLTKFGSADPASLKPLMARMSGSMDEMSQFLERRLPGFSSGNDRIIELTEYSFDLTKDFPGDANGKSELQDSIRGLLDMLAVNKVNLDTYLETLRDLPRMSTNFNRARRRAITIQEALRAELERLRSRLSEVLQASAD